MADSYAPPVSESTDSIMSALTKDLPSYMQVANNQVLPQASTQLAAAQQISPQYTQLLTDLYSKYAPQLAQAGSNVDNISRTGAANTDLSILQNQGGDLVKAATALDKQLNPEYYNTKALESSKIGELLNGVSLDNPNPEAERLVNQENVRSGNINTPSATNTVANAISFGDERLKRMSALGSAIGQATQFLQPAQSQFNPVVTALNRPSSNTGSSQFNGVTNPSNVAYDQAGNMLNNITSLQSQSNQIKANQRDVLDRMNEVTSSLPSVS